MKNGQPVKVPKHQPNAILYPETLLPLHLEVNPEVVMPDHIEPLVMQP